MLRKGLAVAVILLFIGVAFAPSINADVSKDELVEFDVEFCGLGKKHTVQLTQQEADEVELLFDDIEQRLSEVETREEAEEIFKDAIVELDRYGLLGGMSVKQAQRLIIGRVQNQRLKDLEKLDIKNQGIFRNRNFLCLTAGITERQSTRFLSVPMIPFDLLFYLLDTNLMFLFEDYGLDLLLNLGLYFLLGYLFVTIAYQFIPFSILNIIHLYDGGYSGIEFLFTIGLSGINMWLGDLKGKFPSFHQWGELGIIGFTGIKIGSLISFGNQFPTYFNFFIGHSLMVNVEKI